MHRYYINHKYFVNNLTTLSIYQKSFINNNIVYNRKSMCSFNYKIVIGSQREKSNVNLTLTSIK